MEEDTIPYSLFPSIPLWMPQISYSVHFNKFYYVAVNFL